jgi:general stress protein 26
MQNVNGHAKRQELPFESRRREIVSFLASPDNAIMTLATSAGDRVLARLILVTCEDLDVYFFTWGGSRKCEQIRDNPRVALCKDRVQIEGTAEILGGLFDPANVSIRGLFEERFPETVETWRDRPGMVLVKITPISAVLAGEPGEEPHLQFVDLKREIAYVEPWADH